MIQDVVAIIKDYWLLLLINRHPNGLLGGLAIRFFCRRWRSRSPFPPHPAGACPACRSSPPSQMAGDGSRLRDARRAALDADPVVLFLVPLWTGADVPSFWIMLVTLVIYEGAFLSKWCGRTTSLLGQGQMDAARAFLGHSYMGAMRYGRSCRRRSANMIPSMISTFVSTIMDRTLGYVIKCPGSDLLGGEPDQQPALTQPFQVFIVPPPFTTCSAGA